ncbi:hypothetical protein [Candidatus Endoriftia persephone]|jgi:hypothetical protein|nr:hypothetical protein [Candidatus Endoriftia persephone]EGV50675.1 hypothetical protein Rifp1Sym_cp00150 [endosymbiont of Riftia pachyptila (vent Ph05)]USF87776.1 hypothetical protein L0Y14_00585 [Candidatus Endoriftia persephone]
MSSEKNDGLSPSDSSGTTPLIIKNKSHLLILLSSALLVACSAHPGAGIWVPMDESDTLYSKIAVTFEGRAELFVADRETHLLRCFWGGITANSISMDCISADDESEKHLFTLQVSDDGIGMLSEADKTLGLFRRTNENPSPRE